MRISGGVYCVVWYYVEVSAYYKVALFEAVNFFHQFGEKLDLFLVGSVDCDDGVSGGVQSAI